MNQKDEKGKAPPSPNPAMAFDPAHLLGMHSMAAAGLPYAPLSAYPSPYSLMGQPPPFPNAAAAMFGGLNLNPMANPLHAAALSHSLAAASLYGLPNQTGDLGSPHNLLASSAAASSSAPSSSSSTFKKSKSSSSSSSSSKAAASSSSSAAAASQLPRTSTPSNSHSHSPSPLVHHYNASNPTATPNFSPFDSAAAIAAMSPYLPGWALNGSAYHMTQLANQMAEAHKRTESHHTASNSNRSSSSSSSQQPSSSSSASSSSNTNRNKPSSRNSNRSRTNSPSGSSSGNKDNNRNSGSTSSSRKIPPAHEHTRHRSTHDNKNSRATTSSSPSPYPHHNTPMLNIPQALSSSESKKSSSSASSKQRQAAEGMEFDPRSMITPYQLAPELAYLSQSLLMHRPDLAALHHSPFLTPSADVATTSSSISSGAQQPQSSSSSKITSTAVEMAGLEPGQLHSSSSLSSSSSSSSSKRKKEESKSESDHRIKELDHQQHSHSDAQSSLSSSSLPYDLSQSSSSSSLPLGEQHSMDNIRKKKIADQIRKRMSAGSGAQHESVSDQQQQQAKHEQLQQQLQQQAMMEALAVGGLGSDLFAASGYGLRQSDWLDYLAKEKSRLGVGESSESSKNSASSSTLAKQDRRPSLEANLQQQEEELKELQKKYALAMAGVMDGTMDIHKARSRIEGETSGKEAGSESDNMLANEDSVSGSDSEGSGRDTPKRGTDSADSGSPAKKRCYQTDERELVIPLEHGWNRQTVINGMGRRGIVGDVYYFAPCGKKLKTIPDVMRYVERNPNSDLGRENFSFNTKVNVGQFYEVRSGMSTPVPLTDTEVLERIEMSRGKRARMQMLARKKREKAAREQALARQIMENKLKRKMDVQEMSRRAADMRFEKKLEKQKLKESERKLKEDKAVARQKEKEQKQHERVQLQEQLRKEKELRAQQIIEARNRRQQELEEMRLADTVKRTQEKELKRQQLIMVKEQERERRRQHILLIKALEQRKKQEDKQNKERMREEKLHEKLKLREIRMSQRKVEMEVAQELKKPIEDMELKTQKPLPEFPRLSSRMAGRPIADCLMVVEFLNNFGSALNLEKSSLPTLQSLENGLMGDSEEEVEEVMSLVMHLLRFAIDDVGVPNPKEAVTKLNQKITEMEMTDSTMSEILRIFLQARGDKQLSDLLKEKPLESLNPTHKASMLAFLCNELLTSKVITGEIDKHMEGINNLRRDKWIVEGQLRQLRVYQAKKFNKIHRSTMDRRRNNSNSNNSSNNTSGSGAAVAGGGDGDDSMGPPGKMGGGGGGSDDEEEDKEEEEGSGNESDGSTSAPISSANTSINNMPFEPVDDSLTLEESDKRIENLQKQHLAYRQNVFRSSLRLRAINIGEDRYKRTYWILPRTGGVFVEGMESGEPEDYRDEVEGKIKKEEEEKRKKKERVEYEEEEKKKKELKREEKEEGGGEGKGTTGVKEEVKNDEDSVSDVKGDDGKGRNEEEKDDESKKETKEKILVISNGHTEEKGVDVEISEKKGKDNVGVNEVNNEEDNEEDVTMDDDDSNMNNEDDDDDVDEGEEEEDEEDDNDNDDDNEMSNITGISETASWTDSDFNDSNMSFSGLKTSASPIRSSSVKVTVDMNGHSDDDSRSVMSCDSSNIRKNLSFRLENGMTAEVAGSLNSNRCDDSDSMMETVSGGDSRTENMDGSKEMATGEDSDHEKVSRMNNSEGTTKSYSSLLDNNSCEGRSSLPSVLNGGKALVDSCRQGDVDDEDKNGGDLINVDRNKNGDDESPENLKTVRKLCEDVTTPDGNNVSATNNVVNGFADNQKDMMTAVNNASSPSVNCSINSTTTKPSSTVEVLSVDMTLNKVEIDTRVVSSEEDGGGSGDKVKNTAPTSSSSLSPSPQSTAAAVCVDLSKHDQSFKTGATSSLLLGSEESGDSGLNLVDKSSKSSTESIVADKALPSADILRVPRLGQSRESSLFSMTNNQSTLPEKGINNDDGDKDKRKQDETAALSGKTLVPIIEKEGSSSSSSSSVMKPNSILSSSLLFSPSSLSPSSLSPPQQVTAANLKISSTSTSSSITNSSAHSRSVKGLNGDLSAAVNLSADPFTSPAPHPAHSKPINRQALPPFHPSAMANIELSQTPPAAHSNHSRNKQPPLHHVDPPPISRPTSSHYHQTPPHSFNNPALPVSLYGDSSASQALSSLASFASPPPAHQHRSASSSLLTSTPKLLTSTTTSTNTTSAPSATSSKTFKSPPAFSSIIDEVLKNEPEYSSSQLLHHAASQVRRGEKDVPQSSSSSSSTSSSKTSPLSKLPLTSSELSSLITSAVLASPSNQSAANTNLTETEENNKSSSDNQQNPMWFSLLPRTPCDELSLTRRTTNTSPATTSASSSSSSTLSTDPAAVASLLLNHSTSITSLLNTLSVSSSSSSLSIDNLLSLLQASLPLLSQEAFQQSLNHILLSPSPSPSPSPNFSPSASPIPTSLLTSSTTSCDFKVPQPPLDSISTSSLLLLSSSSSSAAALISSSSLTNYDPWDLLREAQGEKQFVPPNKQHGWWRIFDLGQMKSVIMATMNRGIREHNLTRSVQRYLDFARGHVTYDSSIGETDPNVTDDPSKNSNNLKRKSSPDKSSGCSPVKKEKKSKQENEGEEEDEDGEKEVEKIDNEKDLLEESLSADSSVIGKENEDEKKENQDKDGNDKSDSSEKTTVEKVKLEPEVKEEEEKEGGEENKDRNSNVKKEKVEGKVEEEGLCNNDDKMSGDVNGERGEDVEMLDFVPPDKEDGWSVEVMHEIEMSTVEDVEALEDRIYHASLQAKSGWKPNRETGLKMVDRTVKEVKDDESYPLDAGIARLLELEANVERRYLKPPLSRSVCLNMSNMASGSQDSSNSGAASGSGGASGGGSVSTDVEEEEDLPPGLMLWRQAVIGSESPAQLSLCTQLLTKSISWEKSIMKVICQNCRKDDNEAELLLCDGCDKGFHTYCFKPKMENIPEGDWYCFECLSKASGTPHCGLCGHKGGRLAHCSKCPRYIHLDCLDPPLPRVPKRWQCANCLQDKVVVECYWQCGGPLLQVSSLHPPGLPRVPKRWQCANCLQDKVVSKRSRKRKESLPTIQRITKLVVKEEPADPDNNCFPGESTPPSSTPPPPSTSPSSNNTIAKVSNNMIGGNSSSSSSPARNRSSDSNKKTSSLVDGKSSTLTIASAITASNNNSSLSIPDTATTTTTTTTSPPDRKRRKRKEKESPVVAGQKTLPAVSTTAATLTTSPTVNNSMSSPAAISTPTSVIPVGSAAASTPPAPTSTASTPKKKRQRKKKNKEETNTTGAEGESGGSAAVLAAAQGETEGGGGMKMIISAASTTSAVVVGVGERNDEKERTIDFALCSKLVGELENHEHGWPFLKAVNKKQFPLYKKYIKTPMDFTTIRNKVKAKGYKHHQDFASDVRLVFDNCETFNEDDSEVGQCGHNLRQFFERKWIESFPDDNIGGAL